MNFIYKSSWFAKFFLTLFRHMLAILPWFYSLVKSIQNFRFIRGYLKFWKDFFRFKKCIRNGDIRKIRIIDSFPQIYDYFEEAGNLPRHYFYQDIWAARKVFLSGVKQHWDIGSRLDGFVAHCLAFCEVIMIDIRPLGKKIPNLSFFQSDFTKMDNIASNSIQSLSALHSIEHFGLGRYGDTLDSDAHLKAIREIKRVLAPSGNLYISVPIGEERIEFNAHRIFDPLYLLNLFEDFELVEFSAIDDEDNFIENTSPNLFVNARYSCGLFHFRKT